MKNISPSGVDSRGRACCCLDAAAALESPMARRPHPTQQAGCPWALEAARFIEPLLSLPLPLPPMGLSSESYIKLLVPRARVECAHCVSVLPIHNWPPDLRRGFPLSTFIPTNARDLPATEELCIEALRHSNPFVHTVCKILLSRSSQSSDQCAGPYKLARHHSRWLLFAQHTRRNTRLPHTFITMN